jgi:hypothetical protein
MRTVESDLKVSHFQESGDGFKIIGANVAAAFAFHKEPGHVAEGGLSKKKYKYLLMS